MTLYHIVAVSLAGGASHAQYVVQRSPLDVLRLLARRAWLVCSCWHHHQHVHFLGLHMCAQCKKSFRGHQSFILAVSSGGLSQGLKAQCAKHWQTKPNRIWTGQAELCIDYGYVELRSMVGRARAAPVRKTLFIRGAAFPLERSSEIISSVISFATSMDTRLVCTLDGLTRAGPNDFDVAVPTPETQRVGLSTSGDTYIGLCL